MIRILFASAANPLSEIENRYPPLWPAYLTAYAESFLEPGSCEFRYATRPFEREFNSYKPDLVGLGFVSQNFRYAAEYARIASASGVPVIVGGMHVTSLPHTLTSDMTIGCIGEGEQTFLDLLKLYLETRCFPIDRLGTIDGIVYHDDGKTVVTSEREPLDSLEGLPHPKRSLIGYSYRSYISSVRGCEYRCPFCSCAKHWGRARYTTPGYVLEEVKDLVAHGVKVIRFSDDNFVANKPRLKAIADLIVSAGLHRKVRFSCWCRANDVDAEVARTLRSMNVVSCKLGLESGSERILSYLKHRVSLEDNLRAVRVLKEVGMQVNADFIIGAPDETMEDIQQTYDFIKDSPLSFIDVSVFMPLPGTSVWEEAEEKSIVSETMDWRTVNFRPKRIDDSTPLLCRGMKRQDLADSYARLRRLCFIKMLTGLPSSPWRNEIGSMVTYGMRKRLFAILSALS